jgi:hypothetical protein
MCIHWLLCVYMLSQKKKMKLKLKHTIIVCLFFLACLTVGISGYQDSFITSLSNTMSLPKPKRDISILPSSPYKGQFTAIFDRLGIVKIRISTEGRINTNTLVFRLREHGTHTWLVENTYVTDRFIDGEKYPFGFPIILNSKRKTYEYELTTVDGSEENTIAVLPGIYSFQTDYIYSKTLILTNRQTMIWFLKEKVKEVISTLPHIEYWIMCFLPLLFITNAYALASICMIVLFGFLPVQIHSNMVLWIGLSVLFASLRKKNYTLPFTLSVFTLGVCILTYLTHTYYIASKLATIIPILLTVGGITTFISIKHKL